MPKLKSFTQTYGRHQTTGSIAAALDYMGAKNPLTGMPYSEAFLLGISGGIAFGYFTFEYKGYDPQVNILTRNTFNNYGWDTITARLGLAQDVVHSTSTDKAQKKLVEVLEEGRVPIVWADTYTLGYERSDFGDGMWMMVPLIVTAYEPGGAATVIDRAKVPIDVDADLLDRSRGKVKKDRFCMILLESPAFDLRRSAGVSAQPSVGVGLSEAPERLAHAVKEGLADCVLLYTEKPPVGSAQNFGFKAYRRWATLLTKATGAGSWAASFTDGRRLHAALSTAYSYGLLYCKGEEKDGERGVFADFLDEVSGHLTGDFGNGDSAHAAAELFRKAGGLWSDLGERLLPGDSPILAETRELLDRRHAHFLGVGPSAELDQIDSDLDRVRERAERELLSAADNVDLLAQVAAVVQAICAAEEAAVESLKALLLEI